MCRLWQHWQPEIDALLFSHALAPPLPAAQIFDAVA